MNCKLKYIENVFDQDFLSRLVFDQGRLDFVDCLACRGLGRALDASGDVVFCGMRQRVARVNALLDSFASLWDQPFEMPANAQKWIQDLLCWGESYRRLHRQEGCLFFKSERMQIASHLWLAAVVMTLRFDFAVHMVILGKTSLQDLLPPVTVPGKTLVFVDQLAPLWKKEYAYQLDYLVSWCEGAHVPLWLQLESSLDKEKEAQPTPAQSFRRRVQARINKNKKGSALEWLQDKTHSRLKTTTKILRDI